MKTRVDLYDDPSLNKILYLPVSDIILESAFQIENGYYLQIHIEECGYEWE